MAALVGTDWLGLRLGQPGIRIVEATWYLPTAGRQGIEDYRDGHIPGAAFWDIDAVADPDSSLPHMLPDEPGFAAHMERMGISNEDHVVVYDNVGMMTSPRVWWCLRAFGHDRVSVLDGGMLRWRAEGRPTTAETPPVAAAPKYVARLDPSLVRSIGDIRDNIETGMAQILDARSAARFTGVEPEPRPECRPGHMPRSLNLPFGDLIDPETGIFRRGEDLAARFAASGLEAEKPVITSCGSGVTACVLALGLHLLGRKDVAVYDGSWSEWGSRDDTPVET